MHKQKIRRMTTLSLLTAVIVVLQLLGYVLPRIGPFGLSFVLIPIVIGAAYYGPKAGAILGGAFGVIVCFCSYNGIDGGGFMVWQASPLLCILVVMTKGILAGTTAGWVYRLLHSKSPGVAIIAASIICPIVNTGVFLLGMFAFFMDVLRVWADGGSIVGYVLTVIVLVNFVPEFIITAVLSPACRRIIQAVQKN